MTSTESRNKSPFQRFVAVKDTLKYNTTVQTELAYNTLCSLTLTLVYTRSPEGADVALIFAWSLITLAPFTAYLLKYFANERAAPTACNQHLAEYSHGDTRSAYRTLAEAFTSGQPQLPYSTLTPINTA
jgi:hypothetical protein